MSNAEPDTGKRRMCILIRVLKLGLTVAVLVAAAAIVPPAGRSAPAHAQQRPDGPNPWSPKHEWRKQWRHGHMSPRHRHRMQRHWTFMNGQIPERYQNVRNPFGDQEGAIRAGQKLYGDICARCHGFDGLGDGEAGHDLFPSPALLAFVIQSPIAVDSYLMWTISEGGEDLNTKMPAYKDSLSEGEIWQLISFLRNGFALP